MWRRILVVVLPFIVDGMVALALANGGKPAQPASPRMVSTPGFAHGAGLPLLVADSVRPAALRPGKKSPEQRVLR